MSDKKDQNLTDKEVNMEGVRDEGKTYIDGQGREMIIHSKEDKKKDIRNPLVWLIPVMVIILIIPLMILRLPHRCRQFLLRLHRHRRCGKSLME